MLWFSLRYGSCNHRDCEQVSIEIVMFNFALNFSVLIQTEFWTGNIDGMGMGVCQLEEFPSLTRKYRRKAFKGLHLHFNCVLPGYWMFSNIKSINSALQVVWSWTSMSHIFVFTKIWIVEYPSRALLPKKKQTRKIDSASIVNLNCGRDATCGIPLCKQFSINL